VTGTFDNWAKTQKLEKVGDHFEATIEIPEPTEKILYKVIIFLFPPLSLSFIFWSASISVDILHYCFIFPWGLVFLAACIMFSFFFFFFLAIHL
jgi:hypothetical protein